MRRFLQRLLNVFRADHSDAEATREINAHLALLEDEYVRRGMSADDARRAARRALGSAAHAHDLHRDARTFAWLDDARRDVAHDLRSLRRTPGFTAIAVITLALGIGANTTFFAIVNAICLRDVPIERPDDVLMVGISDAQNRLGGMSYPEFKDMQSAATALRVAAFANAPMMVADEGRAADRFLGAYLSGAGFDALGTPPMLGRGFQPDDDRPGAPPVVVLAENLWRSRYAGDRNLIGQMIVVNGAPSTVIGVMPVGFKFPINTDVWQPLVRMPGVLTQTRDVRLLFVFGRLTPQATTEQARAEMETIVGTWTREFPESSRGIRAGVIPINEQLTGRITERTWLSFITAGVLVLLIACANLANLLLMRGVGRAREMAIRSSIGATRGRLIRQLLIESAALAVLGGALGVAFSLAGLRMLSAMVPADALPYWMTFTIDGRVLAVLLIVCLGSVFVFGLAPAFHLLKIDIARVTNDGGRLGTVGVPARRWVTAFLVLEFALSLVLLAAVVTGVRQQRANGRSEFSLDASPILSMWVTLPNEPYQTPALRTAFFDRLIDRFAGVPGVTGVTLATVMPRIGGPTMQLEIADHPTASREPGPTVIVVGASEDYFDTLGVPLVGGRRFTSADGRPGQEAAIVNQRFAEMFFGTSTPIERLIRVRRLGTNAQGPWARIVGVSPTIRQFGGALPDPVVYLPFRSLASTGAAVMVSGTTGDVTALAPSLREELRQLDPSVPFYRLMTLDRAIAEAQWNGRQATAVIQSIASIALMMALVGLYAVTSHAVKRWKSELGIRVALGARPRDVASLVLRRALTQLGLGLLAGVACTYAFDRLFTGADQAIRLTDAAAVVPLVGFVAMIGMTACIIPIRRAAHLDPVEALRHEE